MGVGVRHAVQMDQAGGGALRRHPARLAISWPGHITDVGGIRTQFHHVIDVVPTLLEATGIEAPEIVNGIKQKPIEGVSMMYTFDKANANAPSTHHTQYFEMMGDHAIYHDGWIASTKVMRPPWDTAGPVSQDPAGFPYELYDVTHDWTQFNNLAAKYPDKVKEMDKLFWEEAAKYQVMPLDATWRRASSRRGQASAQDAL